MAHVFARGTRKRRSQARWQPLELLETRRLLSAAIQVSGNSQIISNNDVTPSIADFTDFGPSSTTFNAQIGRVTRTFVIADTGDATLNLLGGVGKQIKISGANAKDFVLSTDAASSVAASGQTSFTLTFAPKGTGVRRATVTIASDDPTTPAFTFNIQGEAYKAKSASNGLQVATITKGTGAGAVMGAAILTNYTLFLPNTELESSTDPGLGAVDLRLGVSNVIDGWTQGLAGIKAGETRLLEMPASLGYGTSSHNSVPANSPLIFLVTATTMANPTIVVSGNDIPIALNDKTPDPSDNTVIGVTPAGSLDPISATFKITNGSDGIVTFPTSPVVMLTGKGAASFSASPITIDPTSTFATFTVTFTPTKVGTQTAVVHVRSSDPVHKDFTFTVSATASPSIDYAATGVGTINYPASGNIVAGASTNYKVPVTVTNLGNVSIPGSTPPVQFNFYLHDTTSGDDTLISSQTSTSLRGTGAGKSKTVNFNVPVPQTVTTGNYQLLVKVNENGAVGETNSSNNSALSSQVVSVTQGQFNVDGQLSASTLPTTLTAGQALPGTLSVLVRNTGTLTLPPGQKFTLQVLAHPDTGADVPLGMTTLTLSSWAPSKTQVFSIKNLQGTSLTAGHYVIEALLTPVQALTESSTSDNLVTTLSAGGTVDLTVS